MARARRRDRPARDRRDPVQWYDVHAARYEADGHGLPGEVEYYVEVARAAAPPVLELGCGTGRITLAIARAGVPVVGLDASTPMLELARAKAEGVAGVRFVPGDMRDFALNERFGAILIPYRTFMHLLTDADQVATLARCREHLVPRGVLALNVFCPPSPLLARAAQTETVVGRGAGGVPLRFRPAESMRTLLADAGFIDLALHGWFDGASFNALSAEQVWTARTD